MSRRAGEALRCEGTSHAGERTRGDFSRLLGMKPTIYTCNRLKGSGKSQKKRMNIKRSRICAKEARNVQIKCAKQKEL